MRLNIPTRHHSQDAFYKQLRMGKQKWNVAVCGRGYGKDVVLEYYLIARLLDALPSRGAWMTHRYRDAKKAWKLLKKYVAPINQNNAFDFKAGSPLTCTFRDSVIEFHSFNVPDSIRGENYYDYVIINEACQLKNDGWTESVQPVCNFADKVIIATTPRVGSWVREWFDAGIDGNPNVFSICRPSTDNPKITEAMLAEQRKRMPDAHFRQEYLAEWIADGEVFSNINQIFLLSNFAQPDGLVSYGVDIGVDNDYTVVTGLNSLGQCVYFDRFRDVRGDSLIDRIIEPAKTMPGYMVIETNGIGKDVFFRVSQKALELNGALFVVKFNTSGRTKHDLMKQLIFFVNDEKNRIQLPTHLTVVFEEMQMFKIYQSRLGNPEYRAPSGHHDDTVMSLGLAVDGLKYIR